MQYAGPLSSQGGLAAGQLPPKRGCMPLSTLGYNRACLKTVEKKRAGAWWATQALQLLQIARRYLMHVGAI